MIWPAEKVRLVVENEQLVLAQYRREIDQDVPRFVQPPGGGSGSAAKVEWMEVADFTFGLGGHEDAALRCYKIILETGQRDFSGPEDSPVTVHVLSQGARGAELGKMNLFRSGLFRTGDFVEVERKTVWIPTDTLDGYTVGFVKNARFLRWPLPRQLRRMALLTDFTGGLFGRDNSGLKANILDENNDVIESNATVYALSYDVVAPTEIGEADLTKCSPPARLGMTVEVEWRHYLVAGTRASGWFLRDVRYRVGCA